MAGGAQKRLAWILTWVSLTLMALGFAQALVALGTASIEQGLVSHVLLMPLIIIPFVSVGLLILLERPGHRLGWLCLGLGGLYALNLFFLGYSALGLVSPALATLPGLELTGWTNGWFWIPGLILPTTLLLLIFPSGHLPGRRWAPVAWAAGLGTVGLIIGVAFAPGPITISGQESTNPYGLAGAAGLLEIVSSVSGALVGVGLIGAVASIILAYRAASGLRRRQYRHMVNALIVLIAGLFVGGILTAIAGDDPMLLELSIVTSNLPLIAIPLSVGMAILRDQLYEINPVVHRTLVYGALTAIVVNFYIFLIGAFEILLRSANTLLVSLLATILVVVVFQPLRDRLEDFVNRLMYGDRDDPVAVLSRLGKRLEATLTPQAILPGLVETVAEALRLPTVAIWLREGESYRLGAVHGRIPPDYRPEERPEYLTLPLIYQSELIGRLEVAPRLAGEPFNAAERRLLEGIARQAGAAVYAVQLTAALQRSRQRLVSAREEERRRLRRDLHDGLGPQLASLTLKMDAARNLLGRDPGAVDQMLGELKSHTQAAVREIRRLVYDLRPPALDELGLVAALRQQAATFSGGQGLQVTVEAPEALPELPAAVEVAAYRIVLEGLANVAHHAGAQSCVIRIQMNGGLQVEVEDDGMGIAPKRGRGVGLTSMHERAAELGGTFEILPRVQGGTHLRAQIPLEG